MNRILQRLMLCLPALLMPPKLQAQSIYTVMAVGDVKAVDRETGTVTLDHGPLLNLNVPPSLRVFHVADRAFLEGVKAGDAMRFIADSIGGRLTIVEIETGRPDDHGHTELEKPMSPYFLWSRRKLFGIMALGAATWPALAQPHAVRVFRDPSCGCCGEWAGHLKQTGYEVLVEERSDLDPIKRELGVPTELWACHTATVAGYALEGHVPTHALARLLVERPSFKGIAVPGMPIGSPGMEGGHEEVYEVIGFDGPRRHSFGRYRGTQPV